MRAALLGNLGVESVAARTLIPCSAARSHVDPPSAVTADGHARGEHGYGGVRIKRLIEIRVRINGSKRPGFGLGSEPRRIHEFVVIAAETEDRGRVQRVGGAARIRIPVPLAAAVGNK